jgi:hypothetical protein
VEPSAAGGKVPDSDRELQVKGKALEMSKELFRAATLSLITKIDQGIHTASSVWYLTKYWLFYHRSCCSTRKAEKNVIIITKFKIMFDNYRDMI